MSLDYQDALLKDINKDLLLTNANLKDSSNAVTKQGKQLTNIEGHLVDSATNIKKTDNTMFIIEWRARCYRYILYSTIILEFLTIIILLFYKLFG